MCLKELGFHHSDFKFLSKEGRYVRGQPIYFKRQIERTVNTGCYSYTGISSEELDYSVKM